MKQTGNSTDKRSQVFPRFDAVWKLLGTPGCAIICAGEAQNIMEPSDSEAVTLLGHAEPLNVTRTLFHLHLEPF